MMTDARAKGFDVVLVYKYDRFARKRKVFFPVIDDLEGRGIKVRSATESGDWLAVGLYGLMAEQYSRMLSDRMKDVRRWEAQQGILPGPVPVGYERIDRQLHQTPAAEAVRVAFQLYCTGDYGSHRITDAMNATGHTMPDGSPFKVTAVEEILRCPVYAGLIPCQGAIYPGQHAPIIDQATWERAQEVAQRRARRRPVLTPRYPLLAGMAVCAACGAPMWHSGGADNPVYMCSAHVTRNHGLSPDIRCIGVKCNALYVEHAVCAWLAGLALTPGLIDRARDLLSQDRPSAPPIRQIDQQLKKLKQAFLGDEISAADYEAQRAALIAQPLPTPEATPIEDREAVLNLVGDLPTLLIEASAQHRQAIVRQLISEAWIKRRRVIALRPTRLAASLAEAASRSTVINAMVSNWAGWASALDASYRVYDPVVWLQAA